MYRHGNGVTQDYARATLWYRKAAEQGHLGAQVNLALMYFDGLGVPQDDVEAAVWRRKSADQGDPSSQFNLGSMYRNGRGVPQDDGKAAEWYCKAAEEGHAPAQYHLAGLYYAGRGVPQDFVQAYKWASLGGVRALAERPMTLLEATSLPPLNSRPTESTSREVPEEYKQLREEIAAKMTPEQIAEAQRLIDVWTQAFGRSGPLSGARAVLIKVVFWVLYLGLLLVGGAWLRDRFLR